MTTISKSFVTIADSAVDPDSPLDTTLITGLRDNAIHLREWLGAGYYAGAVQNHDHDGVNSALIPIGPNLLRNGSFENGAGLDGWNLNVYTGGTIAINTANESDGVNCVAITSTVLANGGGDIVSDEYVPAVAGRKYTVEGMVFASVANVSSYARLLWYDQDKSLISISNAYGMSATPTSNTNFNNSLEAPASAKYVRVQLIGGYPALGSATGTIYFDAIRLVDTISMLNGDYQVFTASGTWTKPTGLTGNELVIVDMWGGGGGSWGGWAGGGGSFKRAVFYASQLASSYAVTVGAGGAAGGSQNGGNSSFAGVTAYGGCGAVTSASKGGAGAGTEGVGTSATGGPGWVDTGGAEGASLGGSGNYDGGGGGINSTSGAPTGGKAYYGGGGGSTNTGTSVGGASVYGGGGGGYTGGASRYGGRGGNNGENGVAPGGGAGPVAAGARGEVRIWVIRS